MYNYDPTRISKYWPDVARIEIKAKQTYVSAFEKTEREMSSRHMPDFSANFHFKCINGDCTAEYFDLSNVVSSMAAHHETERTGKLECIGREAKDHPLNRCPCELDYEIRIEYK